MTNFNLISRQSHHTIDTRNDWIFVPDEMFVAVKNLIQLTGLAGRRVSDVVLQHFTHPLKFEVAIKVLLPQHIGVPEVVVRPHGVIGDLIV